MAENGLDGRDLVLNGGRQSNLLNKLEHDYCFEVVIRQANVGRSEFHGEVLAIDPWSSTS